MRVKVPESMLASELRDPAHATIGGFYQVVRHAIVDNADAVRRAVAQGGLANQVGSNLGCRTFTPTTAKRTVEDFLSSIDMISGEGEDIAWPVVIDTLAVPRDGYATSASA
jgi:hypothetical protein